MDNSYTKIVKSKSLTPFFTLFSLALSALSAYCLILPFIKDIRVPLNYAFMAAGGIGFLYFTFTTFNCAYQLFKPKNAVLVSDEGFLDLTNGGNGAGFIHWSNVRSVEMCGSEKKPYIGIGLADANEVIKIAGHALEKQITELSEAEKPELMLRPFEIDCTLKQAYQILTGHRNAYLRTVDHGDTNVLFGDSFSAAPKRTHPVQSAENDTEPPIPEISAETEEKAEKDREQSDTNAKTIDELLAELAESIGKSRQKIDGGQKPDGSDIGTELEQFLKKLRNKENKDGK
ncbi:MAG: hypothetical protein PHW77_10010 [Eubacteriales bacterium]|nr:hypothetical protein [Eubacteriales bacterium]